MKDLWFDPLIKAAKDGDDVAARALVLCMAECLERGVVPPAALAEYFAKALRQIASLGVLADKALNITGKSTTFRRDCEIAREVWQLTHRTKNRLRFRHSSEGIGAFKTVAEQRSMHVENVERIYKEKKALVEAEFLDDQITDDRSRHQFEVDMQLAFAKLAEALEKHGRN